VDADGVWEDPANWLAGDPPDAIGARAYFGPVNTAERIIRVQDGPGLGGNHDNNIVVGEIVFDSPVRYLISGTTGHSLTLDSDAGLPSVVSSSVSGHARHFITGFTFTDDLLINVETANGLQIGVLGAANRTVHKIGRGHYTAGLGPTFDLDSTINLLYDLHDGIAEGQFGETPRFRLDGGELVLTGATTSPFTITDAGGAFRVRTGTMSFNSPGQFNGTGSVLKRGAGTWSVTATQSGSQSTLVVQEGLLDLSAAPALPLPNTAGIDVVNFPNAGRSALRIGNHDYSSIPIHVRGGAQLIGPSGPSTGLGSLVRGQNLTLDADAIVVGTNAGAADSIGNLGPSADLFLGIGADLPSFNATIGTGTPWKGISGNSISSVRVQSGLITANSDFALQGLGRSNVVRTLELGDHANGAVNIVSNGPRRTATVLGIGVSLSGDNADLSGVAKFVVPGTLSISGRNLFGTGATQVPLVEMLGGTLSLDSTGINGDESPLLGTGATAATIQVQTPSTLSLLRQGGGDVHLGGRFVVNSSSFTVSTPFVVNDPVGSYSIDTLTVNRDASIAGPSVDEFHNKSLAVHGETNIGSNDVALAKLKMEGPLVGSGNIQLRNVTLDGNLSQFTGDRVTVSLGVTRLGDNRVFNLGPTGPQIELTLTPSTGSIRAWGGVLSIGANVDVGPQIHPNSEGVLALRGLNSELRGVNGSRAFIGADGTATLNPASLAPGADNTYRLGGRHLVITPPSILEVGRTDNPNLLTGPNHVQIGSQYFGYSQVHFLSANNYTGPTTIESGNLILRAEKAIGNGVVAGPVTINGSLTFRDQGTIGETGPIHLTENARLEFDLPGDSMLDRIPDETPIEMRGSNLSFISRGTTGKASETIAKNGLILDGGINLITVGSDSLGARLNIGGFDRRNGAFLQIAGIERAPADGSAPKHEIHVENIQLANGIVPYAIGPFWFVTSGPHGLVTYEGPFHAGLNGAGPTDNVDDISGIETLVANTTVSSMRSNAVNLDNHVLNVGTAVIDGLARGRIAGGQIGFNSSTGALTSGQVAFAPNSAFPAELILEGTNVRTPIIDNAGPDGIFGNSDDLPVTVTVVGRSGATLESSDNRYSGGTIVNGSVTSFHSLPPGRVLLEGTLTFDPPSDQPISLLADEVVTRGTSNLNYATGSTRDSLEVSINSLTVVPRSNLTVNTQGKSQIGVNVVELLDIRGAAVSGRFEIFDQYLEDAETRFFGGGPIFENGRANEVAAVFRDTSSSTLDPILGAHGTGTILRFRGEMYGGLSEFRAQSGGRIEVMSDAIVSAPRIEIAGDSTGNVEFAPGFKLVPHPERIGVSRIILTYGGVWTTNDSGNLPNFLSASVGISVFPRISLVWDNTNWTIQSNPHVFQHELEVLASISLRISANLSLTEGSILRLGQELTTREYQEDYAAFRSDFIGGAITKLGPATFDIGGRLQTTNYNAIEIREGRVLFNNSTSEGFGTLDVRVHPGATLGGGNADGSRGLIPGIVTVKAGGILAPGDGSSHGILNIIGDQGGLSLEPNAIFQPSIGGDQPGTLHDLVRSTGEVSLGDVGGNSILDPELTYSPTNGDLLFLIENDLTDPTTGLFRNVNGGILDPGSFIDVLSAADNMHHRFLLSYTADTATRQFSAAGNDVALLAVPIPEPSTCLLLLLGVTLALTARGSRPRS
jgi:hypothetical protein